MYFQLPSPFVFNWLLAPSVDDIDYCYDNGAQNLHSCIPGFRKLLAGVAITVIVEATNTDAATIAAKITDGSLVLTKELQNSGFSGAVALPATAVAIANPTAVPTTSPTLAPTQYIKSGFIAAAVLLTLFGVAIIILLGVYCYRARKSNIEEGVKEPNDALFSQELPMDVNTRGYDPEAPTVESTFLHPVDTIPQSTV